MSSNQQTTLQTTDSSPSRRELEFDTCGEEKIGVEVHHIPWDWLRIRQLFEEVLSLSTERKTTDSNHPNDEIQSLAKQLYPHLPKGKGALRTIRTNSKRYIEMAYRSRKLEARDALKPYRIALAAIALAAGQKLAEIFCVANWRDWDPRAFSFYQELQLNLGKIKRMHFATLTFTGNPTYEQIRSHLLKDFTGNHLYREGFESVEIVAFHPTKKNPGRMHVHVMFWSKCERSIKEERAAIERIKAAISSSQGGFGFTEYRPVTGVAEILKVSAYMAWNYSQTLKVEKGEHNPIPKGARVVSKPQNCLPGQAWVKVGKTTLVTPAKTAWRKAVSRYAEARGRSTTGDRRWIWRERRLIREFLEPEEWWESSFTGLDGYTYHIRERDVDCYGNEVYRVESEDGRSFFPTEKTLEEIAGLQIVPNALPKKSSLDFTTGKTAIIYEMLGLYGRMSKDFYFDNIGSDHRPDL
jgi:hypothetical protein